MKKWIVAAGVLLGIIIIILYASVPASLKISSTRFAKSNTSAIQRTLLRSDLWNKWGSGNFLLRNPLINGADFSITSNGDTLNGQALVIAVRDDSSAITFSTALPASRGPLARLSSYFRAVHLKNQLNDVLQRFADFCSNDSNVYGLKIVQTSTKDTFLLSTRFFSSQFPTFDKVYLYINKLRQFVAENNLAETGYPMLNITRNDSRNYRCMVAVPINRLTTGKGDISFVRMVPGRFLTAELKGGPSAIERAHETMQEYFRDYKRVTMAIPFDYLVTDRLSEKDTTNWITRLYYPVY